MVLREMADTRKGKVTEGTVVFSARSKEFNHDKCMLALGYSNSSNYRYRTNSSREGRTWVPRSKGMPRKSVWTEQTS